MTTPNGILITSSFVHFLLFLSLSLLPQVSALFAPSTFPTHHMENHLQSTELQTSIRGRERGWKRSTSEHTFQLWKETYHSMVSPLDKSLVAVNTTKTAIEVNALLAIKKSIQIDPLGAFTTWINEENSTHCNTWKGVHCNEMGHITSIELMDLRLNGTINPMIGKLIHLSYLNLSGNNLFDNLPLELRGCKSLAIIDLSFNYLNGKLLPGHLYTLSRLKLVKLSYNMFSGPLPDVPKNSCPNLTDLRISFTNLSGAIPSTLAKCKNLRVLFLNCNQLNGSIPISLSELHKLEVLNFGNNSLTGHIPSEIASLKSLRILNIEHNNLQGPIPTWLGSIPSLVYLNLGRNRFTGHIPNELASLKNLQILNLGGNSLQGYIPSEFGALQQLQELYLFQSNLSGPIPPGLCNCTSLMEMWLGNNTLSGHIPFELGSLKKLRYLDLQMNNLSGQIPPSLGNCSSLKFVLLNDNNLMGTLPNGFGDLTILWPSLYALSLSNNKFEGNLPLSFSTLNSTVAFMDFRRNNFSGGLSTQVYGSHLSCLRIFLISFNQLEGPIPPWFGDLKSLQVLDLSHNKLTGSIPQNFGNLDAYKVQSNNASNSLGATCNLNTTLLLRPKGQDMSEGYKYILSATTYMDMSSNELEGEIPSGITDLVGMKYFILSNNKLQGGIPSAFQYMKELETLDLSQNNLTGVIPSKLPFALSTFNVSYNNLIGIIPTGDQFNTFDVSSYLPGNPELCGDVIKRPCVVDNIQPIDDNTSNGVQIFDYGSLPAFAIGLVSGFLVVVAISLTWAPAFTFVFGGEIRRRAEEKRVAMSKIRPLQYGLFKYPT